ncbi:MAG: hypothetical protein JWR72_28 [Flavisolibacter sp.]|jgi:uncharacterized protein (DUF433 family)|nr:hypothetical protein [Flavisolibacter sp.]
MKLLIENTEAELGEGIFLTKDVAQILNLPYPRVRYWMNEMWSSRFGHGRLYAFGDNRNKAINFYTLIEFYTFSQLRLKGVSAKKIKEVHDCIAKDLKTPYPFAQNVRTDGRGVWYEQLGELVKADRKRQIDLKKLLEPFLHRIDFGKYGIAERYFPLDKSKNIVVDPKRQFGQVTVAGRNIRADIIFKLHLGGESIGNICTLYDLKVPQVRDAIRFYKTAA